jgi:hypothetical protein
MAAVTAIRFLVPNIDLAARESPILQSQTCCGPATPNTIMRTPHCHVETFINRACALLSRDVGFTCASSVKPQYPEAADFVGLPVTMSRARCKIPHPSTTCLALLTRDDAEYHAKSCGIMRLPSTRQLMKSL